MAFEFDNLFGTGIRREFKPRLDVKDGEGLILVVNEDIITGDFLKFCAAEMNELKQKLNKIAAEKTEEAPKKRGKKSEPTQEPSADAAESILDSGMLEAAQEKIAFMSRTLGGQPGSNDTSSRAIKSWELVRQGDPVPIAYETFAVMPVSMLTRLFNFCVWEAAEPTKKSGKPSTSN